MGTTLKHSYQPNGKGATATESLSQPDDIVTLGGNLYVGFQNGVGSQGEARHFRQPGQHPCRVHAFRFRCEAVGRDRQDQTGCGAGAATGQVFATVNEDSKSSLYTVSGGTVTHYTYAFSPLPHLGSTDAVAVEQREDPDQRVRAGYLR